MGDGSRSDAIRRGRPAFGDQCLAIRSPVSVERQPETRTPSGHGPVVARLQPAAGTSPSARRKRPLLARIQSSTGAPAARRDESVAVRFQSAAGATASGGIRNAVELAQQHAQLGGCSVQQDSAGRLAAAHDLADLAMRQTDDARKGQHLAMLGSELIEGCFELGDLLLSDRVPTRRAEVGIAVGEAFPRWRRVRRCDVTADVALAAR